MAFEIIVVILAILGVIAAYYFLKTVSHLLINTVIGLIIFFIANSVFNVGVPYSFSALLVCALGGIPGSIIVILLHLFGIAF
ncbi:MAG: pro-sigmaK processing inhibitor BofA family protein [Candidatus Methanoperedens sp.]|nr:pro-sigmaK processing inhibitor BofA family protein [Candidatus Methanoperedens sp.]